jgi:Stigma-specific protein, Stig1/Bacterial TSP3 repeat
MDPRTFDRWTAAVAHQRSRRATFRVLAGGLLGGLLAPHVARAALQADRDGDGLYDDDEVQVYGTNPDVYDTDYDGVGDGEEVYYGSNPVAADGVALGGEQGGAVACADDLVNCNGACVNPAFDLLHCGYCGNACTGGNGFTAVCSFGVCGLTSSAPDGSVAIGDVNDGCDPGPNPPGCYCVVNGRCVIADSGPIACRAIGTTCDYDSECCNNPSVLCCFDGTYLRTQCTDVSVYGNVCPG